jgi:tight adherence protein C
MSDGIAIDLLLVALLAAAVVMLYTLQRSRTVLAAGPGEAGDEPVPTGRLPRLIRQAGLDPGASLWIYWLAKVALLALLPLLTLEIWSRWSSSTPWLLILLLALVGFFIPDLALLSARNSRRRRVRHRLSFFLDLIVALLQSGLNLDQAFRRATRQGLEPDHPLAEEAVLVALELDVGQEHATAFRSMAQRTGVQELVGVAAALEMGRKLGVSVDRTLTSQAELMRVRRREEAFRTINLAALRTLLPVFLCGYPVFMVLVLLPVILEIAEIFSELVGLF